MESPYAGFVGNVWEEFPQLAEWHDLDNSHTSNVESGSICRGRLS